MNYKIEKEDEVGKERRDGCGPRSQGEVSKTMIIHATHYIINYHCMLSNNRLIYLNISGEIITSITLKFTFQEDKNQVASNEKRFLDML